MPYCVTVMMWVYLGGIKRLIYRVISVCRVTEGGEMLTYHFCMGTLPYWSHSLLAIYYTSVITCFSLCRPIVLLMVH